MTSCLKISWRRVQRRLLANWLWGPNQDAIPEVWWRHPVTVSFQTRSWRSAEKTHECQALNEGRFTLAEKKSCGGSWSCYSRSLGIASLGITTRCLDWIGSESSIDFQSRRISSLASNLGSRKKVHTHRGPTLGINTVLRRDNPYYPLKVHIHRGHSMYMYFSKNRIHTLILMHQRTNKKY